ncbi:MAG: hypothetical protein WC352_04905 [Candidatus Omnitrophota bacterium]|jgi:hypothetical protein
MTRGEERVLRGVTSLLLVWVLLASLSLPRAFAGDAPAKAGDPEESAQVLESIRFTENTRQTHQFLNPPRNLHPWLKWLLYSSRLNKEDVSEYYAALKKRDQIYRKALKNPGSLGIRYQGKIFRNIPPYVTPDWADGEYALIVLPATSAETSARPKQAAAVPPARGPS